MPAKSPPKATKILATPIDNVEESRAQRLQRQQSRFRDRGGIFVPSSRNILADILLGKASPIKKLRRSVSASPSKGRGKSAIEKPKSLVRDISVHGENPRRSPRKRGRALSVMSGARACTSDSSVIGKPASSKVADNTASVKKPSGKKMPKSKGSNSSKAPATKTRKKAAKKPAENHKDSDPQSKKKGGSKAKAVTSSASKARTSILPASSAPSKASKSRRGVPQLPDIIEEDEDGILPPLTHSPRNEESSNNPRASSTRKKRSDKGEDSLTDSDNQPGKRKPDGMAAAVKKTSMPPISSDEEASSVQRKRGRTVDEEVDGGRETRRPAKRKKVVFENEEAGDESLLKPKKSVAKPAKSKSVPKAKEHDKAAVKKAPTRTAKRKENSVVPNSSATEQPQAPALPRRGIPKSVLLRLQKSSAPHVVDDEPDPIDFLSKRNS